MKRYRVGIIGFGFMGRVHAYGHLNLPLFYDPPPLDAKITHVCDARPGAAQAGAALFDATCVSDFRQITENPDIDIVHVCTPNHLHAEALLSAMAHAKHIYCDKPLVATAAQADQVESALPGYRATAQLALQSRFFPATMRAKQLVRAGFLGRPLAFRACYLHSGSADPKAPLNWKLSAAAGGGVIADLGSHVLDLVYFLLGEFNQVLAATQIAYPQRPSADDPARMVPVDAEDSVLVLARMKNGAVGTIEATKLATGAEDELRIEIHGAAGAIRFNTMDPHYLETYDMTVPDQPMGGSRGWTRIAAGQRYPAPAAAFPGPKFAIGWLRAHLACLAGFLSCVAAGRPGDPDLAQALYLQRLLDAARLSAADNRWVAVPPAPD